MYKTVRHGENSLQYTILPQEEGLVNVKPRKSRKKGKTAAILTVTVILICGIIATAVLVPFLLTSDLVILPAAFQKFSVSSLHRSHSGNHVVVVAKKPHGWINMHRNPAHPPSANKTVITNSNSNDMYKSQQSAINIPQNTTKTTTVMTTTSATAAPTTKNVQLVTVKPTAGMSNEIDPAKPEKSSREKDAFETYDQNRYTEASIGRNYLDISTTTRSSKANEFLGNDVVRLLNTEIQTTSSPWYQQRWSIGVSYVRWSGSSITENFITIMGGSSIVLLCLITIFILWMRRRRNLRKGAAKNTTDAKADDKDTLLKESTAGSEEE